MRRADARGRKRAAQPFWRDSVGYWTQRWQQRPRAARPEDDADAVDLDQTSLTVCDEIGFAMKQWPHALPRTLALRADCLALHARHPEQNFFLAWPEAQALLAAAERPALLSYVAELLEHFLRALDPQTVDRSRCGAEFWVQRRCAGQGINFHFDKDEALRDACDVLVHPAAATILYLSDGGAPTVVLDVRGAVDPVHAVTGGARVCVGERRRPLPADGAARRATALISYPRAGKLIAFSGSLLHGVAAELSDGAAAAERVTLLVNVWVHHAPCRVLPLPRATLQALRATTRERMLAPATGAVAQPGGATPQQAGGATPQPALCELRLQTGVPGLRVRLGESRRVLDDWADATVRCVGVPCSADTEAGAPC